MTVFILMQKSCYKFISMNKWLYHVNGFTLQTHIGFMLQNGDEQRLCLSWNVISIKSTGIVFETLGLIYNVVKWCICFEWYKTWVLT